MRRKKNSKFIQEKRRFIRLPYVLPVEFYFVSPETKKHVSSLLQGFTRNVSRGGLCLEVNDLTERLVFSGLSGKAEILLYVNLSSHRRPIEIYGRVVWIKKIDGYPRKFLLGVSYLNLDLPETACPVRLAKFLRWREKLIVTTLFLMFLTTAFLGYNEYKRRTQPDQQAQVGAEQSNVFKGIFNIEDLESEFKNQLAEKQSELTSLTEKNLSNNDFFEKKVKPVIQEIETLERKLKDLEEGKALLRTRLTEIEEKKKRLDEKTIKMMYEWLKLRQNKNTGLVISFEGDKFLEDWGFTYDQALAAQCFLLFNDFKSAQKIFNFYKNKAKRVDGGFANAYDVSGGHVVEYVIHSGPNIWLGLALIKYIKETGDKDYLPLVKDIADWIMTIQSEDPEGGVRGGPKVSWFSTEHNLDAYAFFRNLYKISRDKKYQEASDQISNWLNKNAYLKAERRLTRGKGDATIATDTMAWAIATLGPDLLEEEGMNPDDILDFAERNCRVTVTYFSPSGEESKITGFDFAKARNIGRGGVVSSEWTAQMIGSFRIMSDFYIKRKNLTKAKFYEDKAEYYLSELDKLTIYSDSKTGQGGVCLPYATHQNADTGHGWRTPSGRQTGCIAGTVYAIFAKKNFNPFEIK